MTLFRRLDRPPVPLLVGVLFLSAAAVVLLVYVEQLNGESSTLYLQNRNYGLQTALHDLYKTQQADVVMLGNSLTYNVNWNELLGRASIVNRGIVSDITEGYLHRLDAVVRLKPRLCFIEGGINDIYAGVPVDLVHTHYKRIVETLRTEGIVPIIQSTLYVSPRWHDHEKNNLRVAQLNTLLQRLAATTRLEYIDLNKSMATNGALNDTLTYDGVHLNADGYRLWAREVERVLTAHGL
ncbi:MAG TPA: GDSL-type esterase/lipase family protein [Bacteroidota bacterium]|nr:GDSL-type esterase/lipase family protein [Bacteroidota bacterium]